MFNFNFASIILVVIYFSLKVQIHVSEIMCADILQASEIKYCNVTLSSWKVLHNTSMS